MESFLKGIIIFNESGEKREVPLEQGVNIITGDSKTGKSALVEIIDYCFCSSRSTVPKGKITLFAEIYCLLLVVKDVTYVIGRQRWEKGGRMYFEIENSDFTHFNLTFDYFNNKTLFFAKDVQYKIESVLGLQVTNMKANDDDEKSERASLRNMVSYLFQHQNLMASKFALFYRFSDFYKRKAVIEQFPIFAGIIGQEYYSDLIRLNKLKSELKKLIKSQAQNKAVNEEIKQKFSPLMKDYFSQLNLYFDENQTLQRMINIAKRLPEYDDSQLFQSEGIVERYHNLNFELEKLRSYEQKLYIDIQNLNDASDTGTSYVEMLKELKNKTDISQPELEYYSCPLCGNSCDTVNKENEEVIEASKWLLDEITATSKYTSGFSEDIRKLNEEKDIVVKQIKDIYGQVKQIERKYLNSDELVSKREKLNYAKARIMLYVETMDEGIFKTVDQDILDLEAEIKLLEERISGFDVRTKMEKAQSNISANMNKLALTLDFEDEFKPIDLNFRLVDGTFDIYQHQEDNTNIFLYEMGSGANWVSCHIALFLSFLRYFASQKRSPMPLIMFFDQPSQVYFPQGLKDQSDGKDSDIEAVNQMYATIFKEIEKIGLDTNVLPQLIIVDHVDGNLLKVKDEFISYRRKDWRNKDGLI
jgi:hypothetical protein